MVDRRSGGPIADGDVAAAETRLSRERMELAIRLSGPRILLVEDSDLAAAITGDVLSSAGYRIARAGNGAEAVEALRREAFDMVVTDRVMPEIDGLELCRILRSRPTTAGVYVLMLTSLDRKRDIVDGLAAGADDYLTKPFDVAELIARVRAGLRIVGLQRELTAANQALSRLALTDPLTELPNRRAVDEMLAMEAAHQERGAAPSCVGIADIDNFKKINDDHGHEAGDLALVAVGRLLRRMSRNSDTCGRLGGEEFVLVLRGCDPEGARVICERLRREIAALRIPLPTGTLQFTASFGLAPLTVALQPGEAARLATRNSSGDPIWKRSALETLRAADAALYRAKREGRNRVEATPLAA